MDQHFHAFEVSIPAIEDKEGKPSSHHVPLKFLGSKEGGAATAKTIGREHGGKK